MCIASCIYCYEPIRMRIISQLFYKLFDIFVLFVQFCIINFENKLKFEAIAASKDNFTTSFVSTINFFII
jgi:hypothetical protein